MTLGAIHDAELVEAILSSSSPPLLPPEAQALVAAARKHRLEYVLAWRAARRGTGLEAWLGPAGGELAADVWTQCVSEALASEELRRLLPALDAVPDARPVLIKGASLAYSHYPEPWVRPRLDTDILLSAGSRAGAFAALRPLGYERQVETSGVLVSYQSSFARQDRFGSTHYLDVHWKVSNRQLLAGVLTHEEIASRSVPLPALGPAARGPSARDALVLACLHRAGHHHDSPELLWVYDIHLIAESLAASDWESVRETVERSAIRAIMARGLGLAVQAFGTRLPSPVADAIRDCERDAWREPSALYLRRDLRPVRALWADLRTLGLRGGTRLVREHLFPPSLYMRERDASRFQAPLPLRYLLRIVAGAPAWLRRGSSP